MNKIFLIVIFIFALCFNASAVDKKNCDDKALLNKFLCKHLGDNKSKDKKKFSLKQNLKNFKDSKTLSDLFKKN